MLPSLSIEETASMILNALNLEDHSTTRQKTERITSHIHFRQKDPQSNGQLDCTIILGIFACVKSEKSKRLGRLRDRSASCSIACIGFKRMEKAADLICLFGWDNR